jgi:iron complex transport system substrate-binding protein
LVRLSRSSLCPFPVAGPRCPYARRRVGFNEADFALALGVVPVGVRDVIGEYAEESRPWAQEALGGATPEVVGGNELELEKVAALQPDVILGMYSFIDRATYERLSGIAPTVAPPSETVAATWQEQTRITGRALGLTERAEQVVADTEARFAEARAANPEFAGKTLAAGFVVGGETYALGTDDLRTQLFSDLGFTLPATSTTLSRELLGELDKDVLALRGGARRPRGVPRRLLDAVRGDTGLRQAPEPAVRTRPRGAGTAVGRGWHPGEHLEVRRRGRRCRS